MQFPWTDGLSGRVIVGLFLLMLVPGYVRAQNLLANPGFEDRSVDLPARWDRFVQPQPGAVAELSDVAHGGSYGVWLHTPAPYEKEPVNNWSQNIIADLGGKTLKVSGYIRVAEAKEAAIWLQMWRKRPWGVLGAASTSTDMPVYGTEDWQEVSMTVEVPAGTDFVTVRCVLLGTGSAWFDDLSVVAVEAGAPSEGTVTASEPVTADTIAVPEGPAAEADADLPVMDEIAPTPGGEPGVVIPMVNALEAEVRRLRDANVILTDTLQQIQDVNQELLQEMLSIQGEIHNLRTEKEAAKAPPLDPARSRVPPLVPLSEGQEVGAP